ncbi:hypothetical protein AL036_00185 [Salipiger aestuarii]|uniref:GDSL-like lipase/acylhydrolase family protein n=1 Tax=Salipiger aestuarii TaxID=568098 RepID=A0A327YMY4_9RHOB|nr:hypothetical protein [Salipiger aestuarii]KAA8610340.1 hypothetical protein AL036_00185 [Salipiger aestuarii]KAB2543549.1 hypothetical protein AL035_01800 [Salipiger aestuarii]RAK21881.1 hypothetical protein ATI53_100337 [Salipiger aestuarii]
MKILITGDSHTGALSQGLAQVRDGLPGGIDIVVKPLGGGHILPTPFFRDAGTYAQIVDPDYRRNFHRLPPHAINADMIALSAPLWPMRVMHQMVWPRHSIDAAIPGGQPISRAVFRRLVMEDQGQVLALCALLQRVGMPVLAVSPPVMFRDHATLRQMAPEHVRAMFDGYRAIMLEELAARHIPVLDVPPDCVDADGFMRPEYRHENPEDEHHANAAFGALMIRQLAALAPSLLARAH